MAQSDIAENLRNTSEAERMTQEIWSTDVMTGGSDRRMQLYYQLIQSLKKADSVDIIVSFLMESGVKMLLDELDNALKRGAKIRILTGNYLGITQPSALYLLKKKLGSRVDMRFYNEKDRSFHPKSYIFHYGGYSDIYIGSSNISRSALTSGIEWNYRFSSVSDPKNYEKFYQAFEELFKHHSIIIDDEELKRYSQTWHRPAVAKDLERYEYSHQNEENEPEDTKVRLLYEPLGAQIEALCALEDTRAEGAKRALVQAATGVGKTYLAAFDSKSYERVLFVAHREEILKQAAVSFRNVRNSEDYGFFTGEEKSTDKSVIFASVATLGRSEYLSEKYFAPDYFQYLVIDEFHHAVNIPVLTLSSEEQCPIGKWGRMHRDYLKEHRPILFNDLILSGQLWTYLADLNEQAQERLSVIVEQMKEAEGVTEELKASNQMAWVGAMNSIRNRAEEIILREMIYGEDAV